MYAVNTFFLHSSRFLLLLPAYFTNWLAYLLWKAERCGYELLLYFVETIIPGGCYLFQDFLNTLQNDNTDFAEIPMRRLLPVIDASHEKNVYFHESISSWKSTTFFAYKNCLLIYIFKVHIERHFKRSAIDDSRSGNASTI